MLRFRQLNLLCCTQGDDEPADSAEGLPQAPKAKGAFSLHLLLTHHMR